ncbi:MAG: hypothetical protein ACLUD2_21685 [Clostridium sp.]
MKDFQLIVAILLMVLGVTAVVTSGKELLSKKAGSGGKSITNQVSSKVDCEYPLDIAIYIMFNIELIC